MKRLTKIFVNLLAVLLVGTACFGMMGCVKDITTLEVNVKVYNQTDKESQDLTLKVDLYGHLAPKTVDKIISAVQLGYYNNTVFYKSGDRSQIFLGDIIDNNGEVAVSKYTMPTTDGEFERNGVKGSNLLNQKGAIGLWRSWYEKDSFSTSDDAMNSGKATWFMPTSPITAYDNWFCVFAMIDLEDEETAKAFDLIINAFEDSNYEEYVLYYTGEYDASKSNENNGLTAHVVDSESFDETDYFEAKGNQLVCYNKQTIKVPTFDGEISAKVVSIKVA